MGTINYKTSDFVTIGYDCNFIDYDDEFYYDIVSDYYEQVKQTLKNEYFYYFNVKLEPGYYEGFSIDIEFNFPVCLDSYEDKQLAQKEITSLKAFLLQCINDFECCVVYPGWCTGYEDYKNSIKKLNAAIAEMRQTVKGTPTYYQYIKKGA
jgi:hypothetical protein